MPQDRFQTRLPADDADRVEEYQNGNDISESEAVRRLIRSGLEAEAESGRPQTDPTDSLLRVAEGMAVAVFGIVAVYVGGILPLEATVRAAGAMAIPAAVLVGIVLFNRAGGSKHSTQEVAGVDN